MSNFVLFQFLAGNGLFAIPALRDLLLRLSRRRDLRRLERFDDYMLRDIGLTRDDLYALRDLPGSADLVAEIEARREARIAEERLRDQNSGTKAL